MSFLAKIHKNAFERNWRDSWDDWARDDLELTLEMMEQLPCFTLHPCIEKSRVTVWEMISRSERREILSSTRIVIGMKIEILLVLGMDVQSFFFFISFSSFSSSPSLSFSSSSFVLHMRRERERNGNGWVGKTEWESELNQLRDISNSCWHVGPS